jgi:hypothetical protein
VNGELKERVARERVWGWEMSSAQTNELFRLRGLA